MEVTDRRTKADWARVVQQLVDLDYPNKDRIVLVSRVNHICVKGGGPKLRDNDDYRAAFTRRWGENHPYSGSPSYPKRDLN